MRTYFHNNGFVVVEDIQSAVAHFDDDKQCWYISIAFKSNNNMYKFYYDDETLAKDAMLRLHAMLKGV